MEGADPICARTQGAARPADPPQRHEEREHIPVQRLYFQAGRSKCEQGREKGLALYADRDALLREPGSVEGSAL